MKTFAAIALLAATLATVLAVTMAPAGRAEGSFTPTENDIIPYAMTTLAANKIDPDKPETFGELIGQQGGFCPDGGTMTLGKYDPDPSNPEAVVYLFSRGNVPVALRVTFGSDDRIYIYASRRWVTLEEAREQYPSPCDIPTSGR